ncbi:type IV pilus modification PilV family protein [methane-oxidizing endosymbiont of Gigantopelta aegis]|uniref:type IV pilus modification PilV family protein n=1 Tax=methane-oxidizing endosymbiont of Gigantopelta aegis TaxID=2794938 RepID=UPI0018DBD847|nr:type II secretion system protein [methane-oxidizing endosymbiont of Gigantopelta aegis]
MNKNKGFSLLEILVAFNIMAIALSVCLTIFSQGVNNAGVAENYTLATQLAESLLASTGIETALETGQRDGVVLDRFHWRVKIEEVFADNESSLLLYAVHVSVSWGDEGRQLLLTELKTRPRNNAL